MSIPTLFCEKQRFNQWWMWLLIFILSGLTLFMSIAQFGFDHPVGNNPASNGQMVVIVLFMVVFIGFLRSCCLTTRVLAGEIKVSYFPFHFKPKIINSNEVSSVSIEKYRPIAEIGGWGIRYGRSGMAYNVSGNKGLRLHLKSGKNLLVGTQKPTQLAKAVKQAGFSVD